MQVTPSNESLGQYNGIKFIFHAQTSTKSPQKQK